MTDSLTGLIWTKNGNLMATRDPSFDTDGTAADGGVFWQHALDYVKKLNSEQYLGFSDWRLPNVNELKSLLNPQESNFGSWINSQGFANAQGDYYWSSTNDTSSATSVYMTVGLISSSSPKVSDPYLVWPVRSGFAGTGKIEIPKTGQTTCFDTSQSIACTGTGQDADLQIGASWPTIRFTANTDLTFADNLTGLFWSKDANPAVAKKSWQQAFDYIRSLNTQRYLGYSDWRLPNRIELESLMNNDRTLSSTEWLSAQGFINVQGSNYWSGCTVLSSTILANDISFNSGHTSYSNKSDLYYVWPVRGGVDNIPKYGLVASLPFNGNTLDVSGNGNNGSASGATLTASNLGDLNGAYSFNGVSDYISLGNTLGNFSADYTLSFWIKTNATPANLMEIMNTRSGVGTGNWWHIRMTSSGTLFSELGTTQSFTTTIPINDGQFHMVTYSRKGSITI